MDMIQTTQPLFTELFFHWSACSSTAAFCVSLCLISGNKGVVFRCSNLQMLDQHVSAALSFLTESILAVPAAADLGKLCVDLNSLCNKVKK